MTDYHLMQIASLIAMHLTKKAFTIEDMQIPFTTEGEAEGGIDISEMTEEEIAEKAREVSEARRQLLMAQNKKAKPHGG